jgi:hypothetical protein
MSASTAVSGGRRGRRVVRTTLLDLVAAISRHIDDEQLVVQAARELLREGRARLMGSFRGVPVEVLCSVQPGSVRKSDPGVA